MAVTRRMRLVLVGVAVGSMYPALALGCSGQPAQTDSSGSRAAQTANQALIDGEVEDRVEARPGEICVVCNSPVGPGDSAYLVQGQRVPVQAGEGSEFLSNPRKYLKRLKPLGGALFGADSYHPGVANRGGYDQPEATGACIYGGLYILLGLVFAAVCAHRALHTGYNPAAWFALGFAFHVLACLFLLSRPKREVRAPAGVPSGLNKIATTYTPEGCPKCRTFNHSSATQCLGCGAKLSPRVESEVRRVGLHPA